MVNERERITILLGLNYFIHERIYLKSKHGYITKEDANLVMWRNHNIPKSECPIILKSLEILGLLVEDGELFKVIKPAKDSERIVFELKKKLKMI